MTAYIDRLSAAFPPGQAEPSPATFKDMSLHLETPEVSVLLVFKSININVDPNQDTANYWLELSTLYLKEKP